MFDDYARRAVEWDERSRQVTDVNLKKFYRKAAIGFMIKAVRCLR